MPTTIDGRNLILPTSATVIDYFDRQPSKIIFVERNKELKMPSEFQNFLNDLLESVKQMRYDQAARVTKVRLSDGAKSGTTTP